MHSPLYQRACQALIETAPAEFQHRPHELPAAIARARRLCADYLRECRRTGRRADAITFRYHIYFMGYPGRLDLEAGHRRHIAWRIRHAQLFPGEPVPTLL